MLVLTAEDEELIALVESRSMSYKHMLAGLRADTGATAPLTHSHAWNVSVIIYETPLVTDKVQLQDMVVHLVGILVEAAKGIDLVVAAVRDGGVDQARRLLSQRARDLRSVTIHCNAVLQRRVRHDVGVAGRGRRSENRSWILLLGSRQGQ